ncbi:MAG: bifunctional N(6)-L-threonylcarbamoyladenine synthase/serine/threonine protein kinase [Candidatus Altiarchaeota archaeon]
MITLGFEGTAHTLGVGIIDDEFNVLADVKKMYVPESGGIHPREAAQHMGDKMGEAVSEALSAGKAEWKDVELISFSQGPGMGPCLRTAATAARALAIYHKIPILGVNHCIAHIEVGRVFNKVENPLTLYVSGANSQVIALSHGRYRVFGETLDVGAGNMLDKFGREVGLAHPAGPKIEALAREGKKYIKLPYVVKGTDLSFSGLLTAAVNHAKKGEKLEDVCYSLQETAFAMLTEVTERALAHLKNKEVLLTGGVAANKRLQEMVSLMAAEHGASFAVPKGFTGDNGTMIAVLGKRMFDAGARMKIADTIVLPKQRTDDVEVNW